VPAEVPGGGGPTPAPAPRRRRRLLAVVLALALLAALAAVAAVRVVAVREDASSELLDVFGDAPGPPEALPLLINAGGPALRPPSPAAVADTGYAGGVASSTAAPVARTDDDALYQTFRSGVAAYRVPVRAAGLVRVGLHLVEPAFQAPGRRVFDVTAEGRAVLERVDVFADVGRNAADVRTFDVAVRDGVLDLGFRAWEGVPLVAAISVAASPATRPSAAPAGPCDGVPVRPGEDARAVLAAHPAGTRYCFQPGVHRLAGPLLPESGDVLAGRPGAVLSGARELDGWSRSGRGWSAAASPPRAPPAGECASGGGCRDPDDVFRDDRPLRRVASRGAVRAGTFWVDARAGRVHVGDDPAGHRLEQAAVPAAITGEAGGVTVRGLVIEKFAAPAQRGALDAAGAGWRVLDNEVRLNHGIGVHAGDGARVLGNSVHHNGQMGLGGSGDGVLVQANEIAFNNYAGFDPGWEAGGTKWTFTSGLVVRGNSAHHNGGPGLWTDIDNAGTRYEGNLVAANATAGILEEISCSAVLRGNVVVGNGFRSRYRTGWLGGAGIVVSSSSRVEVAGNTVADNANGIGLIASDRGSGDRCGPFVLEGVRVHDNEVVMATGRTGLVHNTGGDSWFRTRGNRFERNRYRLDRPGARRFAWAAGDLTSAQWTAAGQDHGGRFTSP